MRIAVLTFCILLGGAQSATAQVRVGIEIPGATVGISLPIYPELEQIPGYPVYYAPQLGANYFFYDGLYWLYAQDAWYESVWYNGPWDMVDRDSVPYFVLRVPVRYYRLPPDYFRGWGPEAPPHWGDHWGREWQQRRSGWDRWDHSARPAPAPLPTYQRQFAGDRYPRREQQQAVRSENYHFKPSSPVARQRYAETAPRVPDSPTPIRSQAPDRTPAADQRSAPRGTNTAPPAPRDRPTPDQRNAGDRRLDRGTIPLQPPVREASRPQPAPTAAARKPAGPDQPSERRQQNTAPRQGEPQKEDRSAERKQIERPQAKPERKEIERPQAKPERSEMERPQAKPERAPARAEQPHQDRPERKSGQPNQGREPEQSRDH
jgi:hypothetical protein